MTLLAAMLDFSDSGDIGMLMDEEHAESLEANTATAAWWTAASWRGFCGAASQRFNLAVFCERLLSRPKTGGV